MLNANKESELGDTCRPDVLVPAEMGCYVRLGSKNLGGGRSELRSSGCAGVAFCALQTMSAGSILDQSLVTLQTESGEKPDAQKERSQRKKSEKIEE